MSLLVRIVLWLLKRPLTLSDRTALSTAILDRLGALPFSAILQISNESGKILVSGKPIDYETVRILSEGAKLAVENPALKIVWEQIAYNAIGIGVHKAENESQMFFARAALWWSQEEKRILNELAGNSTP